MTACLQDPGRPASLFRRFIRRAASTNCAVINIIRGYSLVGPRPPCPGSGTVRPTKCIRHLVSLPHLLLAARGRNEINSRSGLNWT
jgi:hypothetical protein